MYNPNAIVSENTYLLLDWTMYKEQFFEEKKWIIQQSRNRCFPQGDAKESYQSKRFDFLIKMFVVFTGEHI